MSKPKFEPLFVAVSEIKTSIGDCTQYDVQIDLNAIDPDKYPPGFGGRVPTAGEKGRAYQTLFAAAPELLEALRYMLECADARNCNRKARTVNLKFSRLTLEMWQDDARAAIAKASEAPCKPS